MTLGTSPQWGTLSRGGMETDHHGPRRWWSASAIGRIGWSRIARSAALLHLVGLALILTMGWHDPSLAGSAIVGGLPAIHLAFLMTTGAAAALLTLGGDREQPPRAEPARAQASTRADQLLAQMSHELRTPLNAMMGFSEVMLRELYGPLGHARYQEYAAHISQSSGQLLKSAEDALAVTETMSAVMADRLAGRCERVPASTLVREAWTALGTAAETLKLSVVNCAPCDIPCERRATSQALQHLLREASTRVGAGGTLEVRGRRRGNARSIEIKVVHACEPAIAGSAAAVAAAGYPPAGGSLRVILARLLLEMQGATLSLWDDEESLCWSACVVFSAPAPSRAGG